MLKIFLVGCHGKMGHNIISMVDEKENIVITGGLDRVSEHNHTFQVYSSFDSVDADFDVIIDFSHHSIANSLIDFAVSNKKPVVICTTGLSDETENKIKEASKLIPVFKSGNMSFGINFIQSILENYSSKLVDDYDIEIIEKHHNRKVDAPSGTAFMLAESINNSVDKELTYNYGRHGNDAKRQSSEIGIHAVRGGTIVGEHSIIFAGGDEVIELKHSAISRSVFANGSILAAKFLATQAPGLYNMKHII